MGDYIENICIYLTIGTVVTNMFPDEKYVKYIKMIFGFLLISLLIKPVYTVFQGTYDFSYISNQIVEDDFLNYFGKVEEVSNNIEEYQNRLEERVNELESGGAYQNEKSSGYNK